MIRRYPIGSPPGTLRAILPSERAAMDYIETCPKCGVSLIGHEIPENRREHFGGGSHYNRLIARCDRETDMVDTFECPDCHSLIAPEDVRKRRDHGQSETSGRNEQRDEQRSRDDGAGGGGAPA
jgi:ssDNA-binding Zn-finger/Zn-ribbon topoisomerase 1